jgi:hypothetical protein
MRKTVGLLWIIGFYGLFGAANAQTPSPPAASTQFDGTYAFISATRVNETYTRGEGHGIGQCPVGHAGSLTIVNGHARMPVFEGAVGSQGELVMRHVPEPGWEAASRPVLRVWSPVG